MKHLGTPKLIVPVLCLIGLLIEVRVLGQGAKVEMSKHVEQGSDISFKITTDKAANVQGVVGLQVAPVDGGSTLSSNNVPLGADLTGSVSVTVPFDAKMGKWKVVKVVFFASSGGANKDLTPSGDLTFEVKPHGALILPSQANVEIR